jgi:prepilin-type N-terminal cleavage/methylation domain-containing protein
MSRLTNADCGLRTDARGVGRTSRRRARGSPRPAPRRSAFTLLELLIVIAISGILFAAMASFARTSLTTIEVLQEDNVTSHTVRTALARITRESELAHTISIANATRLKFICTDITGDGADDTVEYYWNSGSRELTRKLNGTAEVFANNVSLVEFEYEYETETKTTVVSAGDELPMVLCRFDGAGDGDGRTVSEQELDISGWGWYSQQFINRVEVPRATSITVRLKAPQAVDSYVYVYLYKQPYTVGYGILKPEDVPRELADVTVPLTYWRNGSTMEVDQTYELWVLYIGRWGQPGPVIPWQRVDAGPDLPDGLKLTSRIGYLSGHGALYFSVNGDLPVEIVGRTTQTKSVLKSITATISATESGSLSRMSRTWTVLNND